VFGCNPENEIENVFKNAKPNAIYLAFHLDDFSFEASIWNFSVLHAYVFQTMLYG
jgi:hypothetical protein